MANNKVFHQIPATCRVIQGLCLVVCSIVIFILIAVCSVFAVPIVSDSDKIIDAKVQLEIIDHIAKALNEVYVFPDVAREMEKYLRKQYKSGSYASITSTVEFAQKLTEDLRNVSNDMHIRVRYEPDEFFTPADEDIISEEDKHEWFNEDAYENFGFVRVERLPGNVGYLQMNQFCSAEWGGNTAAAAMDFLAYSDAIIIDLRQTLGGSPTMVQLLASYFLDEPVHLNNFYIRKNETVRQFWSHAFVPGPRLTEVKLYILTSSSTPSAAEEFAYDMKNLKRAKIIGETTLGAAHPSEGYPLPAYNLMITIPYGRAINPITGTNWEGVGVEPDINTSADEALVVAHLEALKALAKKCTTESRKVKIEWAIQGLEAQRNPVIISPSELRKYVGLYGPRKFTVADDHLEYQRGSGKVYKLIPMGDDKFMIDGFYYLRFQFVHDESGNVTEVIGLTEAGQTSRYKKAH